MSHAALAERVWKKADWEIYRAVGMIPYGRVVSYTDVGPVWQGATPPAIMLKRSAKHSDRLGYDCRHVPWWRVVQENGSPPGDKPGTKFRLP